MITNSREEDNSPSKLEADHTGKVSKCKSSAEAAASSSSSPWLRLKDPRIVRVSRAFGGKDRHSKVCTIRGLRDRRVRLSVSTAIQLYDLQDRLGLNQPSKVVDWLLNAAKDEIDELPPLPIPSGTTLGLNFQSMLAHTNSYGSEFKINPRDEGEEERQHKNDTPNSSHPPSFSALLNNVVANGNAPFGYHWEPSNLPFLSSSSHHPTGSHGFFTSQAAAVTAEDLHNFNVLSLPRPLPNLSLSTGSQILVCPPGISQSSLDQLDPRQVNNHLQMFTSSSQNFLLHNNCLTSSLNSINQPPNNVRPFHFSMAPKFVSQEKNNGDQPNKDDEFASDEWY